jgi:hypothetical protein
VIRSDNAAQRREDPDDPSRQYAFSYARNGDAAAVPCFIGALFPLFLMLARPTMQADAAAIAPPE